MDQRRGLQAAILAAGGEYPGRVQPAYVIRRDLVEFDVTMRVIVAAVHQPIARVLGGLKQIAARNGPGAGAGRRDSGEAEYHYEGSEEGASRHV